MIIHFTTYSEMQIPSTGISFDIYDGKYYIFLCVLRFSLVVCVCLWVGGGDLVWLLKFHDRLKLEEFLIQILTGFAIRVD